MNKPNPEQKIAVLLDLIARLSDGISAPETAAERREAMEWAREQLTRQCQTLRHWPGGKPSRERLRNTYLIVGCAAAELNGDAARTLKTGLRDGLLLVDAAGFVQCGPKLDVERAAAAARWSDKSRPPKREKPPWKSYEP